MSDKSISDPWFGANMFRLRRVLFDLFAELADEDAKVFGLFGKIAAPDRGENRSVRDDLVAVAE